MQEMTKIVNHGGNKVKGVSYGGCSEHILREAMSWGFKRKLLLRLQGGNRVLGWCQIKGASWRMSRGHSITVLGWGSIYFERCLLFTLGLREQVEGS